MTRATPSTTLPLPAPACRPTAHCRSPSGATLDLYGTGQQTLSLGNYNGGGGTVTNTAASLGTLLLAPAASTSATFGGSIQDGSGGVAVTIDGPGTEVFSGVNTYSGPTTISAGTLRVTGSIANRAVSVVGGTLSGNGATGAVTLTTGAITPGVAGAIGTLSTGNLRIVGGSLNYTLGSPGVGSLINAGTLTLPTAASAVTVNFTDNAGANGQGSMGNGTYPLIDYTSLTGGNATSFGSTFAVGTQPLAGRTLNFLNTGTGAGALLLTVTQTNPVMYQDTFNRTGNLNGSSPTIENGSSSIWTAASNWTTSTTSGGTLSQTGGSGSGYLPVAVAAGNIYSLSVNMSNITSGTSNWEAMGFFTSAVSTNFSYGTSTNDAWMLLRGEPSPQTFFGGSTSNAMGITSGPEANDAINGALTIVVDTRNGLTNSSIYWLINGVQVNSASGFNATGLTNVAIGASTAGNFQNFTLAAGAYWNSPSTSDVWTNANTSTPGTTVYSGWSAARFLAPALPVLQPLPHSAPRSAATMPRSAWARRATRSANWCSPTTRRTPATTRSGSRATPAR